MTSQKRALNGNDSDSDSLWSSASEDDLSPDCKPKPIIDLDSSDDDLLRNNVDAFGINIPVSLNKQDRNFLKWFRSYGQLRMDDRKKSVCSSNNCEDFEKCECRRCYLLKLYELDDIPDEIEEDESIEIEIITTEGDADRDINSNLITRSRIIPVSQRSFGLTYTEDGSDDLVTKWDSIMDDDSGPSYCERLIKTLWNFAVSHCSMWSRRKRKVSAE